MTRPLAIDQFTHSFQPEVDVLIDVRSPQEYNQGHIPYAVNLPLFSDEERSKVGKAYHQQGQKEALVLGLELTGPKMANLVREIRDLAGHRKDIYLHCWRGGMRSHSFAWLCELDGFNANYIQGGYKAYRRWCHYRMSLPRNYLVVGGRTGSGKTDVLYALKEKGEQVLDLEGLAHHKGSAFGGLGQDDQPTVEQFENNLQRTLDDFNSEEFIWVEGESKSIGRVYLPNSFWRQMIQSPMIFIDLPREIRIQRLVREYSHFSRDELAKSLEKIQKRLGGARLAQALKALDKEKYEETAAIALDYYDNAYVHSMKKNRLEPPIHTLSQQEDNPHQVAESLLQFLENHRRSLLSS